MISRFLFYVLGLLMGYHISTKYPSTEMLSELRDCQGQLDYWKQAAKSVTQPKLSFLKDQIDNIYKYLSEIQ